MNLSFRKPIFTFVTDLTAAALTNEVELNWAYPTLFNVTSTHNSSTVLEYKLYRHLEQKYPPSLTNGGAIVDPANYATPFCGVSSQPEPIFKLIATLSASETSYIDDFSDLSVHADEGITYNSILSTWVDSNGANVLDEIFHTERRLYYKITALSQNIVFNSLPFIYLSHTDGIECKSTITQVKWNTLYKEGDTIWYNNTISNCNRTAVDLVFDTTTERYFNVWTSTTGSKVYCLDGRTGDILKTYTLPFTNLNGLRVDPDTGDGIVIGNNRILYRCKLSTESIIQIGDIGTTYTPNGNTGLTLTKESGNHYIYIVANQDVVSKYGIDTLDVNIIPRTTFGCSTQTNANIPNVLGITNSTDNAVWVNGHTPIRYQYSYSYTDVAVSTRWTPECPDGSPDPWYINYFAETGQGVPWCDPSEHLIVQRSSYTTTVNVDVNFLQDIGYVYGATTGINKGITHGQSSPYSSGSYKPFTSKTRSGWFGKSIEGSDTFGRPYTTGSRPDPTTAPIPAISQKGLASNIPQTGELDANNYNIFQTNAYENRIHKLSWNGTTLNYNYNSATQTVGTENVDYWSITNPVHIAIDSQNNIWVIQNGVTNPELTIIHQLDNNDTFPTGGNSRWPTLSSTTGTFGIAENYIYGTPFNDPYIEFYLTRNTSFAGLTTIPTDGYRNGYGCKLIGDLGTQRSTAKTWCLAGNNFTTQGIKIYTYYDSTNVKYSFTRVGGDTTEYNSDNLGTLYAFSNQYIETYPDITHPRVIYPVASLKIRKVDSTPVNTDGEFWNNQNLNNSTNTSVSGYDDFMVQLSAIFLSVGSFRNTGYTYYYDDKIKDIGGDTNPTSITTISDVVYYNYHDPSQSGKPKHRTNGYPGETNGRFEPYVVVSTNSNGYAVTGDSGVTSSINTVTAVVFERWPTAKFYITPVDTDTTRQDYLTSWNLTAYDYDVGDNGYPVDSELRIVSGYDPLSANFTDTSISRTWPISSWIWNFGDGTKYLGFDLANNVVGVGYTHVVSANVDTSDPISQRDESTATHSNMVTHIYKGAGTYWATLYVQASNSGTTSWNISAGVTDETIMNSNFVMAASRRIDVLEICPVMSFEYNTLSTIPASFNIDDNFVSTTIVVPASVQWSNGFSTYGLISGYAPFVRVTFTGYVTSRSLPMSAIRWDFSDPYDETDNAHRYTEPLITGWPNWSTTASYIVTASHTFTMPGWYDVTLVPVPSSKDLNYVSNCTGFEKPLHVYVEEIMPKAIIKNSFTTTNMVSTSLSGESPLLIYFSSSATKAGSFPICRMDWDFGDGSTGISLSRLMSADYIKYTPAYMFYDISDPRNYLVSHLYNRTSVDQPSSYTVSLSVYACNTNSVSITSIIVAPITMPALSTIEGDIHLIDNRMYDNNDLLLVFEGSKNMNTYSILISSERL